MENYIAVKPYLDLDIFALQRMKAWQREVNLGAADPDANRFLDATFASVQSLLMREALFFDQIHMVQLETRNASLADQIAQLTAESGGILSLVDPYALPPDTEPFGPPSEAVKNAFMAMIAEIPSVEKKGENYDRRMKKLGKFKRSPKPHESEGVPDGVWQVIQENEALLGGFEKALIEDIYPSHSLAARMYTLVLEVRPHSTPTPLLPFDSYLRKLPSSKRQDVAQLVVRNLPLPENNTPWEKIIDYRQDSDNRKDLVALRRWIRKLSTEDLSPAECAEELEWLQNEYQTHMRLHKIKSDTGALEVIVKAPLELLENLVTLKFSKMVDPLFAIKKRQISLMEAELSAPGREIAYLVKAKEAIEK